MISPYAVLLCTIIKTHRPGACAAERPGQPGAGRPGAAAGGWGAGGCGVRGGYGAPL